MTKLNIRIINFEEELFESKTIQLDLLDQLNLTEDKLDVSLEKIEGLLQLNKEMEKYQGIYIDHKGDNTDTQLEKFLNNPRRKID